MSQLIPFLLPYPLTFQISSAPGCLWRPRKCPEDHRSQEMRKDDSSPSLNRKKPTQPPNSRNPTHPDSTPSSASSSPSTACSSRIHLCLSSSSTLLKQHITACPTTTHPTHRRAFHSHPAAFPRLQPATYCRGRAWLGRVGIGWQALSTHRRSPGPGRTLYRQINTYYRIYGLSTHYL